MLAVERDQISEYASLIISKTASTTSVAAEIMADAASEASSASFWSYRSEGAECLSLSSGYLIERVVFFEHIYRF